MDTHKYQPPIFDLNNLDEDHEIRFEYDENGNLTRIRKVNRYEGFGSFALIFIIFGLVGGIWWLLGS